MNRYAAALLLVGGTDARMAEVNRAWEQAQEAAR